MISKKTIDEAKELLVKAYKPLNIYLFGSYAWGKPTSDSDLDICIIVNKSKKDRAERTFAAYKALFNLDCPKDIIVYTKEEFEKSSSDKTTFSYKIKKDGKLIYAKS